MDINDKSSEPKPRYDSRLPLPYVLFAALVAGAMTVASETRSNDEDPSFAMSALP